MFAYDSFRQARWYNRGRLRPTRLAVIHCTVSAEMGTGAEAVANYFATTDRKGSTHAVADNDSLVGCVHDEDTAFGAAGANADGLHLELVGMPDQSLAQWLDAYSRSEFAQAARLLRYWSDTYDIPLRWLSIDELRDGRTKGLTTHADCSVAFPAVSTGHWDPGPNFPRGEFLNAIAPPLEDFLMALTADQQGEVYNRVKHIDDAVVLLIAKLDEQVLPALGALTALPPAQIATALSEAGIAQAVLDALKAELND